MNVTNNISSGCDFFSDLPNQHANFENIPFNTPQAICRLCLDKVNTDACECIVRVKKYMVENVVPDLNLELCDFPMICRSCLAVLKQVYIFKQSCLRVEAKIRKTCEAEKHVGLIDLEQLFRRNTVMNADLEDHFVCRTCLCFGKATSHTKLGRFEDDPVQNILHKCLPEMDIDTIKNPSICADCLEQLEEYFHFLIQCLTTEEKIKYYCEVQNVGNNLNMEQVFNFTTYLEQNGDSLMTSGPQIEVVVKTENEHQSSEKSKPANPLVPLEPKCVESPQSNTDVVTLQIMKNSNGEDIISSVEDSLDDDFTLPSDVLEISHAEDFDADESGFSEATSTSGKKKKESSLNYPKKLKGPRVKCSKCPFNSISAWGLNIHYSLVHKLREGEAVKDTCSICGFSFKRGYYFNKHVQSHSNKSNVNHTIKPHIKSKTFIMNGQLLKMFKCRYCPYQSRMAKNIEKHNEIHKTKILN